MADCNDMGNRAARRIDEWARDADAWGVSVDVPIPAPNLQALLSVLTTDGHDIRAARDELLRLIAPPLRYAG